MKNSKTTAFKVILFVLLFATWTDLFATTTVTKPNPKEVVVIANLNSPESLELASFYLKHRKIPKENFIVIDAPTKEDISRDAFIENIFNPIRRELIKRGIIEGYLNPRKKDFHKRHEFKCHISHFKYMVLCKGVPLKIKKMRFSEPNIPDDLLPIFRTTQASVDSELALITATNQPLISWQQNPLFEVQSTFQFYYRKCISVCRIDAPTLEDAKRIITDSIAAEADRCLIGRAYIDLHNHHRDGNIWLNDAALYLRQYGYDVEKIAKTPLWSDRDRHDKPAIYFGWYTAHASGPMLTNPIPRGAIGAHIHSFSATSIATSNSQWVSSLIEAGFAVTFGNVYEPYLQFTLRPDRFIQSLLQGRCLGDASLYAQPVLSWQNVTIGDPLYQPFEPLTKKDYFEILSDKNSDPYLQILALNRIATIESTERSADLGHQTQTTNPSIPLAHKILTEYHQFNSRLINQRLIEYFASEIMIPSQWAYLYFDIWELSLTLDDPILEEKLLQLIEDSSRNWPVQIKEDWNTIQTKKHH